METVAKDLLVWALLDYSFLNMIDGAATRVEVVEEDKMEEWQ